jgi:hypothetical protein
LKLKYYLSNVFDYTILKIYKESDISFPTKLFKIRMMLKLNLFGTRGQKPVIAVDVTGRQRLSAFSVDHLAGRRLREGRGRLLCRPGPQVPQLDRLIKGSGVNQIGILWADF